ncbi:MAG: cyclic nucleotide-binding domain-containing protein [bacterium]|nr:cyclic nucleotide-binding domain-containing protein [bacterium]
MLRETEFLEQLRRLLGTRVRGLSEEAKREVVARLALELADGGAQAPACHVVPFVTGRRPRDEATHPGLGSSANAGLLTSDGGADNVVHVLWRLDEQVTRAPDGVGIDLTLAFTGPGTSGMPLPGWEHRPLDPLVFAADGHSLRPLPLAEAAGATLVVAIPPAEALLPGTGWAWDDVDPVVRATATDGADPFTFGHRFLQELRVTIRLTRAGVPFAACEAVVDVCDARRLGSLYRRVLERVVGPDVEAQRRAAQRATLEVAHHPWFPVLAIASDRADLHTRALVGDLVHGRRNLTDPRWLLRVGLYLEILTVLGIVEAVRDDVGDLLTPAERRAWETSPVLAPLRAAVDAQAWRAVWARRKIALAAAADTRGGVSLRNLMVKRATTLAFLHAHHEDLKRAIELAGPNEHNAQETWHRVYRDAERAVLRKTETAFPELRLLNGKVRDFLLWHRQGRLDALGLRSVPGEGGGALGDQDGLYASACTQYRASMNAVAAWAKRRGLMDYTGAECVPADVSLLLALMDAAPARQRRLQRRDGYGEALDVGADAPPEFQVSHRQIAALLATSPIFAPLTDAERDALATRVRPIALGPVERIIVQGRPGSSLFVLADGSLEVLRRQPDGVDLPVGTLARGAVFGEMSLLTGEPRGSTVRSVDEAIVYEIGTDAFRAVVAARPGIVDDLAALMAARERASERQAERRAAGRKVAHLSRRIRGFLLGRRAGAAPEG